MQFDAHQPMCAMNEYGQALVLINERKKEVADEKGAKSEVYEYDAVWLSVQSDNADSILEAAKEEVMKEITAYDESSSVNEFSLGGFNTWLPKETRMGLRANVQDAESLNSASIDFWLGLQRLTIKTEDAKKMLEALEVYAFSCFGVTASHKASVFAMNNVEDVLNYDYTTGYPDKLTLNV